MNTKAVNKTLIRAYVRGIYGFQKVRIETGNRLCAQFRAKLGLKPSDPEHKDKEAAKAINMLREEYKKVTDGVTVKLREKDFVQRATGIISDWAEFQLIELYLDTEKREETMFRALDAVIRDHPIYQWLMSIDGCGVAMTGVLISEIDIEKAKYVSSIWAYAGLDVVEAKKDAYDEDGKLLCRAGQRQGRSRKRHHLVDRVYLKKDGSKATRKSITYNPFLKTKLHVLAGSMLRVGGGTSKYKVVYDGYKHRLQNRPDWTGNSKGHVHSAAIRYMIKIFLADLYAAWKAAENLPAHLPFHEAKLGLKHAESAQN